MRIGAHLSVAKGLVASGHAALSISADTFQFFSRNPRGGSQRPFSDEEVRDWLNLKREHDLGPVVMHIPYTVNMASPKQSAWEFAVMVLREDVARAARVGAPFVVTHPGSHTRESDFEEGSARIVAAIRRIAGAIESLWNDSGGPYLLLETMSGQGTEIGGSPAQLGRIVDALGRPEWLGVCVDTCHVFAAGYDLRDESGVERLVRDLDAAVGVDRVRVVHVNDSKTPCGGRRDRHEQVGRGEIGLRGLLNLMGHEAFRRCPFILETPVDTIPDGWGEEIRLLREGLEG